MTGLCIRHFYRTPHAKIQINIIGIQKDVDCRQLVSVALRNKKNNKACSKCCLFEVVKLPLLQQDKHWKKKYRFDFFKKIPSIKSFSKQSFFFPVVNTFQQS